MIGLIAAISFYTDLAHRKIYNAVTVFGMLTGLGLAAVSGGFSGFISAILGMGIAILMFGWLFVFRVLGAGDVKLLMAFGALGGVRYCAETAILSLIVAAAFGVVQLIYLGKMRMFAQKLKRFFLGLFFKELVFDLPPADPSITFPFGVAMAIASMWMMLENPFIRWGIALWS